MTARSNGPAWRKYATMITTVLGSLLVLMIGYGIRTVQDLTDDLAEHQKIPAHARQEERNRLLETSIQELKAFAQSTHEVSTDNRERLIRIESKLDIRGD